MPIPNGQRCTNCCFSSKLSEPTATNKTHLCRRNPPQLYEGSDYYGLADWPAMNGDINWCGEWRPSTPTTTDQCATEMARFVLLGDMSAGRALADRLIELSLQPTKDNNDIRS